MAKKKEVKEEVVVEEKVEKKEAKKEVAKTLPKSERINKAVKVCVLSVVLIVVLVVVFVVARPGRKSLEDSLNSSLKSMGETFYTDFYYTEISKNKSKAEVSEFLEKFKDVGIKVNLDNLERYNDGKNKEEIAKFKNKDGKACNKNTTQAVIYPKSPYGKTDYTVDVVLDCGFDKK